MKNSKKSVIALISLLLFASCTPPMMDTELETNKQAEQRQHFKWEERQPLRKIKLAGDFFISKEIEDNLPKDKAKIPVDIKFSGRVGTIGDLVFILEQKGIPISYNWTVYEDIDTASTALSVEGTDNSMNFDEEAATFSNSSSSIITAINSLENKSLPFKTYSGDIEGLLRRLKKSMNVSYWWEDETLFLSTNQEYIVSVPQQQDVIDSISSEIQALGATNINSSLTAGQIVYYAKPRAQDSLIKPFLKRIAHNLSEITLQVALVQVEINGAESSGFDWDTFNVGIANTGNLSGHTSATGNETNVRIQPYNGDSSNPLGNIGGSFFRQGLSIFGTETDVSVDLAINILSTIGKTTTEQNVEMRTISGKEVKMESVKEESYVSGYDGGSYGDNPEPASPEFDTVETGLVLTFLPVFDAYNAIVTIDASIDLSNRLADTTVVNAGDGYEEISVKPNIKKDTLADIVRIPVGETVILGGLMNESNTDNRTAPMGAWDISSDKQSSAKQALFLIIRPLVTLYEMGGNEAGIDEEYVLKNTKYNYGKATEEIAKDEAEALERDVAEKAKIARIKSELEKKHSKELALSEAETKKLKADLAEEKRIRKVLETENQWEENTVELDKETEEISEKEESKSDSEKINSNKKPLTDKEKLQMLKMLRGIN